MLAVLDAADYQQRVNAAEAALAAAQAQVLAARASVATAQANVRTAQSTIGVSEANQAKLQKTSSAAPSCASRISSRRVSTTPCRPTCAPPAPSAPLLPTR
ncbi:hypothetical protein ACFQT0_04235 [Hymenobacter humi]|uniref:Uncharacterized protein n=1 Tax=Hymenobacter humi TaxID=1411620 RepID=A0ABW2U0Z4_9BACT